MTNQEFLNEFDILYNNIMSNQAPGLDEYEKSVFLTKAQEELIIELYNGKNSYGDSFEKTEEIRRYISELVKTYETEEKTTGYLGISKNSIFFKIPDDVWFITYESATFQDDSLGCLNGKEALVTPISQDDFYKIQKNPFRGPSKKRVLRLDIKGNVVELVSNYDISKYLVRYIVKPNPIILVNLHEDGLSINGISTETECELNPVIHRAILERAVRIAIRSMLPITGKE